MESSRPEGRENQFKSNLLFLGKFLRHGTKIASFWPSSRALAKATVGEIDFEHAKVIVELGAGTGPITQEVIDRLKPETRFLAIERDNDFARILQKRFADRPNVEIVHADVRDLETVLQARNIERVDAFISGLPTPSLPKFVRQRMFVSVRRYLNPSGVFSNITEIPFVYWKYYASIFQDVDFQFVTRNMPPGGVYHCRAMR